jgi:hypothetical protein
MGAQGRASASAHVMLERHSTAQTSGCENWALKTSHAAINA